MKKIIVAIALAVFTLSLAVPAQEQPAQGQSQEQTKKRSKKRSKKPAKPKSSKKTIPAA